VIKKIVTHPGGAHKDDFLAVSVLIARSSAPVLRRDPEPGEVSDPEVAVVDVGGSDDAALSNFDHHHYPREHAPTCALSLVLKHLGLYEDALMFCDWLEPAEWFDSRGPNKTAEWLGVSREAVARLNSPIDVTLLRRFARVSSLKPGEPLYEVMRYIGEDMLDFLHSARRKLDRTAESVEQWDMVLGGVPVRAIFLARGDALPEDPSASLARYVRAQPGPADIVALVYPDRRGEGYGISRFDDHPHLDFSRLKDEQDVHFAHASGFMCKTTATAPERLKELLAGAWI
jgi:hypothetical protein